MEYWSDGLMGKGWNLFLNSTPLLQYSITPIGYFAKPQHITKNSSRNNILLLLPNCIFDYADQFF